MKTAVYCIATTEGQADRIVRELQTVGSSNDDLSVLSPDTRGSRDLGHEKPRKGAEGVATGAGTGGIVGGAVGWLAGIGTLAIPGVGPFIAAGPILAALGGAAVGATVGGLTGALVGLGIPEYEVKRYEGKLASGNILISVHCGAREEARRGKDLLEAAGAPGNSGLGGAHPPPPDTR